MKSLSSVGLGLSIVFGCLLLALLAELYYLFWWKKRFTTTEIQNDYTNPAARELFFMFCCKSPSSSSFCCLNPKITDNHVQESQPGNKDFLLQPFAGENLQGFGSNIGPGLVPRFLFTIIEETKEDLESEEGERSFRGENKSVLGSRRRSSSDLFVNMDGTPYLTPLASPSLFTPPLTPLMESCHIRKEVFSPFFESSSDAEFNRMVRSSSPPPKFKFLQDAEEKLYRRRLMEVEEAERLRANGFVEENGNTSRHASKSKLDRDADEEDKSFIRIVIDKNRAKGSNYQNQQQSSGSQVLFLASSPSTGRSLAKKSSMQH